jgi:propionate CoA-transferase
MREVPIMSARRAADLIPNGATVSVSSSSGLGCPDAVLRGIGERFADVAAPRGLTTVHPIAAGDTWLRLAFSFASLPAPIPAASRVHNPR